MTDITQETQVPTVVEAGVEDSQVASRPADKKTAKKKGYLPKYKAPFAQKGTHTLPNGLTVVTH